MGCAAEPTPGWMEGNTNGNTLHAFGAGRHAIRDRGKRDAPNCAEVGNGAWLGKGSMRGETPHTKMRHTSKASHVLDSRRWRDEAGAEEAHRTERREGKGALRGRTDGRGTPMSEAEQ